MRSITVTDMRNVTVALMIALIAGCGSVYKQGKWANVYPGADWDIDSAVCLQHSKELTEKDRERIRQIKADSDAQSREYDKIGGALSSGPGDYGELFGSFLSSAGTILASNTSSGAEESVKEEKFTKCMKGKYWWSSAY